MSVKILSRTSNRKTFIHIDNLINLTEKSIHQALHEIGSENVRHVRDLMLEKKTGRIYKIKGTKHQASAPGEAPAVLSADSSEPSHHCVKPKAYAFMDDQEELDSYKTEVQKYKECMQVFVDEQNDAIRNHEKAANSAIEEWDHFTEYN